MSALLDTIQTIVETDKLEMGISAHHIESGETVHHNGEALFPMASVLKIPVLVTAFRQLEQGRFRLEDRWDLQDHHKAPGSGILPYFEPSVSPTVYDLLTLMIIISDNTATDMILDRLGGPLVVEQTMHDLGLTDIHLKLTNKELVADCLPESDPEAEVPEREQAFYKVGYIRNGVAFRRSPENNVSSAKAMTNLVRMIFAGEVTNEESTAHMLTILSKQQFKMRLPRFLPPGTRCDHKTGTLAGVRNDSGLIHIDDNNHVALTLYTIWDDEESWGNPIATHERIFAVETAMGRVGRLFYDYFATTST
ncbi:MAG: serine hydrolase [Chloroflexota bacterium]